jgi:hypothetical protein
MTMDAQASSGFGRRVLRCIRGRSRGGVRVGGMTGDADRKVFPATRVWVLLENRTCRPQFGNHESIVSRCAKPARQTWALRHGQRCSRFSLRIGSQRAKYHAPSLADRGFPACRGCCGTTQCVHASCVGPSRKSLLHLHLLFVARVMFVARVRSCKIADERRRMCRGSPLTY